MKIIIGTKNQKKIEVVRLIFQDFFSTETIEVFDHNANSKVPEAPHDRQTYDGALNRAKECLMTGQADYYVGLESGLAERYGHHFEEAWAVIISRDGTEQIGYSSGLLLPPVVVSRMKNGEMHNDIMSDFDKKFKLPDDNRDTWSRYTGGHISRQVSLEESLRNALIQSATTKRNLYKYK
jgi:inosine/xanthosine triphosphatase